MKEVLGQEEIERLFRQIERDNTKDIEDIISKEIKKQESKRGIEKFFSAGTPISSIGTPISSIGTPVSSVGCLVGPIPSVSKETKPKEKEEKEEKEDLYSACRTAIYDKREEIRKIMKDNTNTTNYILEIVQLIAPAVAQVYLGMSGLAIVGAITLLCKQGIQQMIK